MTEGRQPFTAEIKTLAKGPSTYDSFENDIGAERPSTRAILVRPKMRADACSGIFFGLGQFKQKPQRP
jgi:hypothetical protein